MKEMMEKGLDSELWHACAGSMVQMPSVNSKVVYFPQGHAEHAHSTVDFGASPKIPPMILCRVSAVKYLADFETDEVYAKIGLEPVGQDQRGFDHDYDDGDGRFCATRFESHEKLNPFSKTLTQSDANNGGGFSVPRYCAETVFPPLDYNADPPVQNLIAKDIHCGTWKFRHIYRGTPRRHLLTTGWSAFVNQKKLVAGDSVVFFRAENGDLRVGIRRAKRISRISGNDMSSSLWGTENFGEFSGFGNGDSKEKGKVRTESVVEAASLASRGQPFEVVYYPRVSSTGFFVKASSVVRAMRVGWCSGLRFKMAFDAEDSSRISWFMGTVDSVHVVDPVHWPNSPWRLLQVSWDEPDLLQKVKCVNPWLVEIISNMPVLNFSPFSQPPIKKSRLLHHPDFPPLDGQFPMPSFSGNPLRLPNSPLCCLSDNITTTVGIQGARHAQIGVPLLDFHLSNKLKTGLSPASYLPVDPHYPDNNENVSCLLSIGFSCQKTEKNDDGVKTPGFVLFGQPILTEQQMFHNQSRDEVSQVAFGQTGKFAALKDPPRSLSTVQFCGKQGHNDAELGLETAHCKVFLELEDIGQTLDLSVLVSYEELYKKLELMLGVEWSEILSHLFYHDAAGVVKQAGEEPFSEFAKSAKSLSVLMKPNIKNAARKLITGLPTEERGTDRRDS